MHNAELVSTVLPPAACMGGFDASTASALKQPSPSSSPTAISSPETQSDAATTDTNAPASPPPLSSIISASDFEPLAKAHLSPAGYAYYASGADDMHSIRDTDRLWRLLKLRPRILR